MKLKIIKKLLAAILTAATITVTPGLASAVPHDFLGKKMPAEHNDGEEQEGEQADIGALAEDEEDEEDEEEEQEGEQADVGALADDEKKIEQEILASLDSVFDEIIELPIQTDNDKISFAFNIAIEADVSQFKQKAPEHMSHIIDKLADCATADVAKEYVVEAIWALAHADLLNVYTHEQIEHVVNILVNCATENNAKENVAGTIAILADKNLLNGYTHAEIGHIVDVLINCATENNAKENVADAVAKLTSKNLLSEAQRQQLEKAIA